MPRWFYRLLCTVRLHQWLYNHHAHDQSWPVRKPIYRWCPRCNARQERLYNGYSTGGHGGWTRTER